MSESDDIRELLERRAAALRAGDAERLVADYLPDVVAFTLAPPLAHTAPEVLDPEAKRAWLASFDSAVDFEVRDLRISVDGDLAFCHSLNRMSAVPRGRQEPFTLWYRSTVCLRRVDGVWRVAHEHDSTPFHMDGSFSAALDLTP
ncbi:nuclear transport factor 2 family protein [Saccharothrix sp. S26]|uniref:YybH family protein n=1 Tax=Saccharothrix sp. S26 TaxID=2907215 RepID=UPI001F3BBDE6|nr:nuclear transport factor 2 family protein [Saccharothrix sp. S26]MCE6997507.1 nuclear transport factor 2 family protein [Saccharothrix sp. S26]